MRIAFVVAGGVDRSGRESVIPAILWLIERIAGRHDLFTLRAALARCSRADVLLLEGVGELENPAYGRHFRAFRTRRLWRAR